ncbi:MAG: GWxTD domain-containing protein [Melioribacter sp.]|jgi:GWxTD domain-containing protein|uniref:GWxTD domain-containing protein n=1 Tax=Melioribacter sp. TaxID=2052167 RepID=UPI003BCBB2F0
MTRLALSLLLFINLFFITDRATAQSRPGVLIEKNLLPGADSDYLYLSVRIPYDRLIFLKKQNKYASGYTVTFELFQKDRVIERKTISEEVTAGSYEQTESKSSYSQSFTYFKIDKGEYYLIPSISFLNNNNSILLDTIFVRNASPVIIELNGNQCLEEKNTYPLANYGNKIPFSSKDYGLIMPLSNDFTAENLRIKIEQNFNVISDTVIGNIENGTLSIKECGGNLYLLSDGDKGRYATVNSFSSRLYEGKAKLSVYKNDSLLYRTFIEISWIDKPYVLRDIKYAIDILEAVMGKDASAEIKKNSSGTLFNSLVDYWNKRFPSGKSVYNGLMHEFYRRADYAEENFSTMTNKKGALSDRGIIYIKYGKPDKIERDYSDSAVKEFWYYENIGKRFIFIDEKGLGNYRLEK